ncbi:transposase [Streptomyces sp. NBC_00102]|uniref:transposase n=1 Tax=Streptomyces sp. NBC_00102 TaxID=2975652 RepID=UPI002B1DAA6E|nr:transposase [Streptomyces sp. NBC_00102]
MRLDRSDRRVRSGGIRRWQNSAGVPLKCGGCSQDPSQLPFPRQHLPRHHARHRFQSQPPQDGDRQVLAAIVFVATAGCAWRQLPPGFGPSGTTAHRRFAEWCRAPVWGRLQRLVLDELGARGELDWSRCAIDSVSVRGLKGSG